MVLIKTRKELLAQSSNIPKKDITRAANLSAPPLLGARHPRYETTPIVTEKHEQSWKEEREKREKGQKERRSAFNTDFTMHKRDYTRYIYLLG